MLPPPRLPLSQLVVTSLLRAGWTLGRIVCIFLVWLTIFAIMGVLLWSGEQNKPRGGNNRTGGSNHAPEQMMSNLTSVRRDVPKGTLFVGNVMLWPPQLCHVMALATMSRYGPCQEKRSPVLRIVASYIDADVDCKRGAYKEPLVGYILPRVTLTGESATCMHVRTTAGRKKHLSLHSVSQVWVALVPMAA